MQLVWREFPVSLPDLHLWIRQEYPGRTDGMIASDTVLEIVELEERLTVAERERITTYYLSLTDAGEQTKINRPTLLTQAILRTKEALPPKRYDDLTILERKLILGLPLTTDEENTLIEGNV